MAHRLKEEEEMTTEGKKLYKMIPITHPPSLPKDRWSKLQSTELCNEAWTLPPGVHSKVDEFQCKDIA